MSTAPVPSWNSHVLAASESAFATAVDPAAAQVLEVISFKTGPVEQGVIRDVKDRSIGRNMRAAYIEGRVEPIAWSMEMSQKSRSAIAAAFVELALFKAGGLKETLNASTSAVLSLVADPLASVDFASATLRRILGHPDNANALEAETLYGAFVESVSWAGGDKELALTISGKAAGKRTSGKIDSVTLLIGDTSMTITALESYRLQVGEYYQVESEAIKVTALVPGATSCTIARAQLSTSAAAHAAVPLYPYCPTLTAQTGRPISEATCTASIGGVTTRLLSWSIEVKTGLAALPGETGSAHIQGVKVHRYDITGKARLVLKGDDVTLAGKVTGRMQAGAQAVAISQGTGTGGIAAFSLPYCEIAPFEVPDTADDAAVVDVTFRVRDNAGNDALTITCT